MGMGRLGQVCSPLIVGVMLRAEWPTANILGTMALLPVLAGTFVLLRTLQARRAELRMAT